MMARELNYNCPALRGTEQERLVDCKRPGSLSVVDDEADQHAWLGSRGSGDWIWRPLRLAAYVFNLRVVAFGKPLHDHRLLV